MRGPQVTFVIATYKRADALRCTLRSLVRQAHPNWKALVIGDCCAEETAEAVASVSDPRIRYYNLPTRFGEQSGPNSAGLHLADGDFVSFLNHDDLLLPDHLSLALDALDASGADIYIGKFANATRLETSASGNPIPVFTGVLPAHQDLGVLVTADPWHFDPSSFWVIRTSFAKAVGPWRAAATIWRTPLRDWLMRAWRLGGKVTFGEEITGLRFWTQNLRTGAPLYIHATPEHEHMIQRLQCESPQEIRRSIREQISASSPRADVCIEQSGCPTKARRSRSAWQWRLGRVRRLLLETLYRKLGIDAVSILFRAKGVQPGALLDSITRRRTGASLPPGPSIAAFIRDPEAHRVI